MKFLSGDQVKLGFDIINGSGNVEERSIDVKNFKKVKLAGISSLQIDQTGEEMLRVEAEDNLFSYLKIEVRGDELYLGTEPRTVLHPKRSLNFFLKAKDLEGISLSGSGDIETGNLSVEKGLSVKISGSGKMELDETNAVDLSLKISGSGRISAEKIKADAVEIGISGSGRIRLPAVDARTTHSRISGSGNIEIAGQAVDQELRITASGKYSALGLTSENARVKISGSGSARVKVNRKLDANISGSGSVRYAGSPVLVKKISGSRKVKHIDG